MKDKIENVYQLEVENNNNKDSVNKDKVNQPSTTVNNNKSIEQNLSNFDDDYNEWEIGIGDLIIDLDADIEKNEDMSTTKMSTIKSRNNSNNNTNTNNTNISANSNNGSTNNVSVNNCNSGNGLNENTINTNTLSVGNSNITSNINSNNNITSANNTNINTNSASSSVSGMSGHHHHHHHHQISINNTLNQTGAVEHQATVDKGLKMKIKRKSIGGKSEAKHEIVSADILATPNATQSSSSSSSSTSSSNSRSLYTLSTVNDSTSINLNPSANANIINSADISKTSKHSSIKSKSTGHRDKKERNRERSGSGNNSIAQKIVCENSSDSVITEQINNFNSKSSSLSTSNNSESNTPQQMQKCSMSNNFSSINPIQAITKYPALMNPTVIIKAEDIPKITSNKKLKIEKVEDEPVQMETKETSTSTTSVGTVTEPECLGPCEPGTSVTLEGIVWQETEGGVLVVNVTWRGKTYVGTLLDCTKHDWAPPRLCDSPLSDAEAKANKNNRGKRGRNTGNENIAEMRNMPSKLRNGKGRRTANSGFTIPSSPSRSDAVNPINNVSGTKRKGKLSETELSPSSNEKLSGKRCRSQTKLTTISNLTDTLNSGSTTVTSIVSNSATANNTSLTQQPLSPVLIECPEPNCGKKYKHINGLKYHQTHAHSGNIDTIKADVDEASIIDGDLKDVPSLPSEGDEIEATNTSSPKANSTDVNLASETAQNTISENKENQSCASNIEEGDTSSKNVEETAINDKNENNSEENMVTEDSNELTLVEHNLCNPILTDANSGIEIYKVKAEKMADKPRSDKTLSVSPGLSISVRNIQNNATINSEQLNITNTLLSTSLLTQTTNTSTCTLSKSFQSKPIALIEPLPIPSTMDRKDRSKHKKKSKDRDRDRSERRSNITPPASGTGTNVNNCILVTGCDKDDLQTEVDVNMTSDKDSVSIDRDTEFITNENISNLQSKETPNTIFTETGNVENVQSPAYSDISDANDSEPDELIHPNNENKDESLKIPPSGESVVPPVASQGPGPTYTGVYSYLNQSPFLLNMNTSSSEQPLKSNELLGPSDSRNTEKDLDVNKKFGIGVDIKSETNEDKITKQDDLLRSSNSSAVLNNVSTPISSSNTGTSIPVSSNSSLPPPTIVGQSNPLIHPSSNEFNSPPLQQPYPYPYSFMQGYPYNTVDQSYHMHLLATDVHYKQHYERCVAEQERIFKEQSKQNEKRRSMNPVVSNSSSNNNANNMQIKMNLERMSNQNLRDKQNENHQILKENIELKSQMDIQNTKSRHPSGLSIAQMTSQQQQRSPYDNSRYEKQKEDMRRFYSMDSKMDDSQPQRSMPTLSKRDESHAGRDFKSNGHNVKNSSSSHLMSKPNSSTSSNPMMSQRNSSSSPSSHPSYYPLSSPKIKESSPSLLSSQRERDRDRDFRKDKNEEKDDKNRNKPKDEGVKATMETTGPPPPPTNSYYLHPSYLQAAASHPFAPHLPFDPGHAMFRNGLPPGVIGHPYGGPPPYVHPQLRYQFVPPNPMDIRPRPSPAPHPNDSVIVKGNSGPSPKAMDLLQHYSSHKIHELQDRAVMSPNSLTPSGSNLQNEKSSSSISNTKTSGSSETNSSNKNDSRSPPPQRHLHTHHHTHVGVGYPIYDPYGALIASQQATVIGPGHQLGPK